ncbi:MAG: hypothetical protein MJE77_01125, partial [Proteobacteria bacterium]|nr:hypothetical protein [Pseudomonadota bacterium]
MAPPRTILFAKSATNEVTPVNTEARMEAPSRAALVLALTLNEDSHLPRAVLNRPMPANRGTS